MKVTDEIMEYLGFVKKENRWFHFKGEKPTGLMIYENNVPEELLSLVNTMTGTAYKKGKETAKYYKENES